MSRSAAFLSAAALPFTVLIGDVQGALSEAVSGVYCGWASIGNSATVYKTAMSIGWNPFYKNKQKTAEPWLLHDFDTDFYGEHCFARSVGHAYVHRLSSVLLFFGGLKNASAVA